MTEQDHLPQSPKTDVAASTRTKNFTDYYEAYTSAMDYYDEQEDRKKRGMSIIPDGWLPFASGMSMRKLRRMSPDLEAERGGFMVVDSQENNHNKRTLWTVVGISDYAGKYKSKIRNENNSGGAEIVVIAPKEYFIVDSPENSNISPHGVAIEHGRFRLVGREHVSFQMPSGEVTRFERYCVVPEGWEDKYRAGLGKTDANIIEHDRDVIVQEKPLRQEDPFRTEHKVDKTIQFPKEVNQSTETIGMSHKDLTDEMPKKIPGTEEK